MPADENKPQTWAEFYRHSTVIGDPEPDKRNKVEYKDVIMAEVHIIGDKNTSQAVRVYESDDETLKVDRDGLTMPEKYPKAWAAFMNDDEEYSDGTPVTVLPGVGVSVKRNLAADGITSVEELANLPDNIVLNQGGLMDLRKKARAYVDGVLNPEKAEAEAKAKTEEMDELKRQIAELQANQKKPAGRPRKTA